MNAPVAESVTTSELIGKAANNVRQTQRLHDVEEHEAAELEAAESLVLLRKDKKPKGKKKKKPKGEKPDRKRKRTKKNDVMKASAFIQDTIQTIHALPEVVTFFGECIFYESLFIWQKDSVYRFEMNRCILPCNILRNIIVSLYRNDKSLLKLLIELPSMQSSKHYPVIVQSEDLANQALQRAREVCRGLLTAREFTCIKDISMYCVEQIKVHYIPLNRS